MPRYHYYTAPNDASEELKIMNYPMSLSKVKQLMKKHGGTGGTEHWVGGSFEGTTEIIATANPLARKSTYKRGRS